VLLPNSVFATNFSGQKNWAAKLISPETEKPMLLQPIFEDSFVPELKPAASDVSEM
jgi:hypothetical protein